MRVALVSQARMCKLGRDDRVVARAQARSRRDSPFQAVKQGWVAIPASCCEAHKECLYSRIFVRANDPSCGPGGAAEPDDPGAAPGRLDMELRR